MNKYVLVLGFALVILSIIVYGYHETTMHRYRSGGKNLDGTTMHFNVYETIYPYQSQSYVIALIGIVTFLISLAIPKKVLKE